MIASINLATIVLGYSRDTATTSASENKDYELEESPFSSIPTKCGHQLVVNQDGPTKSSANTSLAIS